MKHIKNDKLTSYKKYLVEIPEDKANFVNKQLVWDLFDNELDIQAKVTGITGNIELIEMPSEEESVKEMKNQNMVLIAEFGWTACFNWLKSKITKMK